MPEHCKTRRPVQVTGETEGCARVCIANWKYPGVPRLSGAYRAMLVRVLRGGNDAGIGRLGKT